MSFSIILLIFHDILWFSGILLDFVICDFPWFLRFYEFIQDFMGISRIFHHLPGFAWFYVFSTVFPDFLWFPKISMFFTRFLRVTVFSTIFHVFGRFCTIFHVFHGISTVLWGITTIFHDFHVFTWFSKIVFVFMLWDFPGFFKHFMWLSMFS